MVDRETTRQRRNEQAINNQTQLANLTGPMHGDRVARETVVNNSPDDIVLYHSVPLTPKCCLAVCRHCHNDVQLSDSNFVDIRGKYIRQQNYQQQ